MRVCDRAFDRAGAVVIEPKRCQIIIPGPPVGWQRMGIRSIVNGGFRTYTKAKTAQFEADVAAAARAAGIKAIKGPVSVAIRAWFEWPRSKWRKRNPRGRELMAQKPDSDNIEKAVLDGLREVFDDRCVVSSGLTKWRVEQGGPARTEILIFKPGFDLLGGLQWPRSH